ncbi:zinc finger, CCHC-type containing protein [Tanacetum coccineum]
MVAAMKHMVANFLMLDKFEGVDFRRWQKKMHFLLSTMSVVYVLTTPTLQDGHNATVKQIRKRSKWEMMTMCVVVSLSMVCLIPCLIFTKMLNLEKNYEIPWKPNIWPRMHQVRSSFHIRIEGSLRIHDSDMPKGNNVTGHSVVNMVEHNNSTMYNDNKGKCKHHDTKADPNNKMMVLRGGLTQEQLFMLNIINDNIDLAFMSIYELNVSNLWHARLGHVHFKRMRDMSKDGLIPTFDMDTEKCKTYMLTKITKKSFQNVKYEIEVLELIHSDLCDLHATPSLGNKKDFVTFIDDASRNASKSVGIKRLLDDLGVTAAKLVKSYNCSKIKTIERVYTFKRGGIKTKERIKIA